MYNKKDIISKNGHIINTTGIHIGIAINPRNSIAIKITPNAIVSLYAVIFIL